MKSATVAAPRQHIRGAPLRLKLFGLVCTGITLRACGRSKAAPQSGAAKSPGQSTWCITNTKTSCAIRVSPRIAPQGVGVGGNIVGHAAVGRRASARRVRKAPDSVACVKCRCWLRTPRGLRVAVGVSAITPGEFYELGHHWARRVMTLRRPGPSHKEQHRGGLGRVGAGRGG
jgi:hypothetical protein